MNTPLPLARFTGTEVVPADAINEAVKAGLLEPCRVFDPRGLEVKGYRPTMAAAHWFGQEPISDEIKARANYIVITWWPGNAACPGSNWVAERREDHCTLAETVDHIIGGQFKNIRHIHAYDIDSGRCWDATKQIAEAIADHAVNVVREWPGRAAYELVEEVLGVDVANELPAEE